MVLFQIKVVIASIFAIANKLETILLMIVLIKRQNVIGGSSWELDQNVWDNSIF